MRIGLMAGAALAVSAAFGEVMRIDDPVALDGRLDEACWSAAKWEGNFLLPYSRRDKETGDRSAPTATEFAVLTDGKNVYFGVKAHTKYIPQIKEILAKNGKIGQWAAEAFELFLCPDGGQFEYYQFLVTYQGNRWATFRSENGNIAPDPYGPDWTAEVADTDYGFSAEVKIPVSAFYMTRNSIWKPTWRINVSRTYCPNGEGRKRVYSCWGDTFALYAEMKGYRELGGFPVRTAEDDVYMKAAVAEVTGLRDGKPSGKLSVPLSVAKGGAFEFSNEFAETVKVTLKDGDNTIEAPATFPENGRFTTKLVLKRLSDGNVVSRTFPVRVDYQPVRVKLTLPQYRGNFYPGQDASRVEGEVATVAKAPVTVTLEGPGFSPKSATLSEGGRFSFDTTGFADGDATLTVTCGKDTLVKKVRKLPPLPEGRHATWVENGNLVYDGRPTIRRGIYATGFMGGKAFDEKFAKDDLHLTPIGQIANIDLTWIARDLKYGEALKDAPPSRKYLDAIDKVMNERVPTTKGAYVYISDEPECHAISSVYLSHVYDYVAQKWPYYAINSCCRSGDSYIGIADWFETHPYINPSYDAQGKRVYGRDFNVLGSYVSAFHGERRPEKCIGGAPTAFAYTQGEYPTFDEYELNFWAEFVRGAKSMYPYAYHDLGDRPSIYEGTRYMFESIEALEDLLLFGRLKTLSAAADHEAAIWTMPGGDRAFAVLNFTQKPLKLTVKGLWGRYREFRGARIFAGDEKDGAVTFELKPLESVIACERARDAGLVSRRDFAAKVDRLEYERTHRDNQLLGHRWDLDCSSSTGRRGGWRDDPIKLFDGTRDVIAWYDNSKPGAFYEIGLEKVPVRFGAAKIWGRGLKGTKLDVCENGNWSELAVKDETLDGDCLTLAFDRVVTPNRVKFRFPCEKVMEVYEIELPIDGSGGK